MPNDVFKKLFREVAQKVHPDRAKDSEDLERRTRLMARAYEARDAGDEAELRFCATIVAVAKGRLRAAMPRIWLG